MKKRNNLPVVSGVPAVVVSDTVVDAEICRTQWTLLENGFGSKDELL